NQHTPKSAIVHHVVNTNSETSISISLVFGIILFVSSVQIVFHQRLKQNGPLTRLFIFQYSKLILFTTYILIHTLILMLVLGITTFIFQQQLSFTFFAKSLVIIIVYELGVSWLLFKINTLSHRLFMAVIFALLMAVLYIFIQL
ncbi:ABC transporter permease, partial [Staphylococcus saprophyticus]|nr:ABC transporter permease [Staphylococcus saprophyticus]